VCHQLLALQEVASLDNVTWITASMSCLGQHREFDGEWKCRALNGLANISEFATVLSCYACYCLPEMELKENF